MSGVKHDADKPRLDLIPTAPMWGVGQVLTFGMTKYGERNWEKGLAFGRLFAASQRHLLDFWDRVDYDDESGLYSLDHACTDIMMLSHYMHNYDHYKDFDDRP